MSSVSFSDLPLMQRQSGGNLMRVFIAYANTLDVEMCLFVKCPSQYILCDGNRGQGEFSIKPTGLLHFIS